MPHDLYAASQVLTDHPETHYKLDSAGDQVWARQWGNHVTGLDAHPDGRLAITGNIVTGDKSVSVEDEEGEIWKYLTPGNGASVVIDKAGNVYLATANVNSLSHFKFDDTGGVVWEKTHGSHVHDIKVDSLGNVYIAGWQASEVTHRKLDSEGDEVWSGDHGDTLNAIVPGKYGEVVWIGGSPALFQDGSNLRKLGSGGTVDWSGEYDGTINKIDIDDEGNVLVCGSRWNKNNVLYLEPSGTELWGVNLYNTGRNSSTIFLGGLAGTSGSEGAVYLDLSDGSIKWTFDSDGTARDLVSSDGRYCAGHWPGVTLIEIPRAEADASGLVPSEVLTSVSVTIPVIVPTATAEPFNPGLTEGATITSIPPPQTTSEGLSPQVSGTIGTIISLSVATADSGALSPVVPQYEVHFEWREVGAVQWQTTSSQVVWGSNYFSGYISGLESEINYEYRPVIQYEGQTYYGDIRTVETEVYPHASISVPVVGASGGALSPTVETTKNPSISVPVATSDGQGLAPQVSGDANITTVPLVSSESEALAPSVTGTASVLVPLAQADSSGLTPQVSGNSNTIVPLATASGESLAPTVETTWNVTISPPVAAANGVALTPVASTFVPTPYLTAEQVGEVIRLEVA